MSRLAKLIAGRLGAGKIVLLATSVLLGGVVVTGVLAGPGGLMAGSGSGDGSGDGSVAVAEATPTPVPTAVETEGDVIACPAGEDTRFKFEQNGSEFELTGALVSLDQTSVVVTGPGGDVTAAMALNTEVKGDPQPGDAVKVEGAVLDDGTLVAREVKPACEEPEPAATPEPDEQDEVTGDVIPCPTGEGVQSKVEQEGHEFEVTGVLVSLDGSTVVVTGPTGDVTAAVAADTEIEGDPQPGDAVKVEGAVLDDGSFLAHEIEPACDDADEDEDVDDENEDENDGDQEDSGDQQDGGQHHDDSSEGHEDSGEHNSGSED